jgi:hypothetical protein
VATGACAAVGATESAPVGASVAETDVSMDCAVVVDAVAGATRVVAEEAGALGDETTGTGATVEDADATEEEELGANAAWVGNPHLMCIWQQPS